MADHSTTGRNRTPSNVEVCGLSGGSVLGVVSTLLDDQKVPDTEQRRGARAEQ
jgi:hypothetical protein